MKNRKQRYSLMNNLLLKKVLATLLAFPANCILSSWRLDPFIVHPKAQDLIDSGVPVIYALWHGRMYVLCRSLPPEHLVVLVSPSNDGEMITRVARKMGFQHFIRGSHKRGGVQAVFQLKKVLLEQQLSVVFTVDGPRGPCYKVKPGVIRLAAQTGAPIIPLGASSHWLLKQFRTTWDNFHVPMPFTRMTIGFGEPLQVSQDDMELPEGLLAARKSLERRLFDLHHSLDSVYGFVNNERL